MPQQFHHMSKVEDIRQELDSLRYYLKCYYFNGYYWNDESTKKIYNNMWCIRVSLQDDDWKETRKLTIQFDKDITRIPITYSLLYKFQAAIKKTQDHLTRMLFYTEVKDIDYPDIVSPLITDLNNYLRSNRLLSSNFFYRCRTSKTQSNQNKILTEHLLNYLGSLNNQKDNKTYASFGAAVVACQQALDFLETLQSINRVTLRSGQLHALLTSYENLLDRGDIGQFKPAITWTPPALAEAQACTQTEVVTATAPVLAKETAYTHPEVVTELSDKGYNRQ